MKEYFAKYLPVEGEIKREIGGMKIFDSKGIIQHIAEDVQLELLPNLNKICKKAKLFLCSKNITFGNNNIRWEQSPYTFSSWSRDKDNKKINLFTEVKGRRIDISSLESECFKIIGEISPEATWVKEGDEFEEKDIKIVGENTWGELHPLSSYKSTDTPKIYCEIKGLCDHFH